MNALAEGDAVSKGCWWTISEAGLRQMLREVADGGDPDLVYAEHYANSGHEEVEGGD